MPGLMEGRVGIHVERLSMPRGQKQCSIDHPKSTTTGAPAEQLLRSGGWYYPSLPLTAFRLITGKFVFRGDLAPGHLAPTERGLITALRLFETLHTRDGITISAVLSE